MRADDPSPHAHLTDIELLQLARDGSMSSGHLATCVECARVVEEWQAIEQVLVRASDAPRVPPVEGVLALIRDSQAGSDVAATPRRSLRAGDRRSSRHPRAAAHTLARIVVMQSTIAGRRVLAMLLVAALVAGAAGILLASTSSRGVWLTGTLLTLVTLVATVATFGRSADPRREVLRALPLAPPFVFALRVAVVLFAIVSAEALVALVWGVAGAEAPLRFLFAWSIPSLLAASAVVAGTAVIGAGAGAAFGAMIWIAGVVATAPGVAPTRGALHVVAGFWSPAPAGLAVAAAMIAAAMVALARPGMQRGPA